VGRPGPGQDASRQLIVNLEQALEHRDLIGQAKGIIMARNDCDAEEAFDKLRAASQGGNEKLYDIAQRIAASTGRHDAPSPSTPAGPWSRTPRPALNCTCTRPPRVLDRPVASYPRAPCNSVQRPRWRDGDCTQGPDVLVL
jgi:ANTAR domain